MISEQGRPESHKFLDIEIFEAMYSVGQLLWSLALSQIFPAAFAELSIPEQKPITDANSVLTTNPIYSKQATCESDSGKIYITSEGEFILPDVESHLADV